MNRDRCTACGGLGFLGPYHCPIRDLLRWICRRCGAFVSDPSLRKTARTGRRAGKTNSVARMLFIEALKHPGAWAVYIGLTRTVAQDQLWQVLLDVNEKYNLGGISNSTRLQIRLPNGAVVALRGADKKREVEKLRGYKICVAGVDRLDKEPEFSALKNHREEP